VRTVAIHSFFGSFDLSRVSFVFALEVMPTLATIRRTEPLLCPRRFGWLEVVAALMTAHQAHSSPFKLPTVKHIRRVKSRKY
jgi:hypothetical protein